MRDDDTMPLKAKGPVRPPPRLEGPAGRVAAAVAAWPGVIAAAHWHRNRRREVDGVDHYVGEAELGHLHLDGELHLATTRRLRERLVARGLARPFRWYPSWVDAPIRSEADADRALWLLELNDRRLCGVAEDERIDEIDRSTR